MILSKPNSAAYRREADRVLAQVTATTDAHTQRELLDIARAYERLAAYALRREREQTPANSNQRDRSDGMSDGYATA